MKLLDFIICDDIRSEVGGKLSFMGVFGHNVALQVRTGTPRPVPFRCAVFFRFFIEAQDPIPESFQILIFHGAKEFARLDGTITATGRQALFGIASPSITLPVAESGKLSFVTKISAGGNVVLEAKPPYDIDISIADTDGPTVKPTEGGETAGK